MNMIFIKKGVLFVCLFGLCYLLQGCNRNSQGNIVANPYKHIPTLNVKFDELLTIGDTENNALTDPTFVRLSEDGKVFIFDKGSMSVKVFDGTGKLLSEFGQRGRAPGEYLEMTCVLLGSSLVYIYDEFNKRVTVLDFKGVVIKTVRVTSLLWPRDMFVYKGNIIFLNKIPYYLSEASKMNNFLFHEFDSLFNYKTSFGEKSALLPKSKNGSYQDLKEEIQPGTISRVNKEGNEFIYAPYFYEGKMYSFRADTKKNWSNNKIIKNTLVNKLPVIEEASETTTTLKYHFGRDTKYGTVNTESLGVFTLKNGNIIHFIYTLIDNKKRFIVELFDYTGRLLGYSTPDFLFLNNYKNYVKAISPAVIFSAKDKNDHFYLIMFNNSKQGIVRIVKKVNISINR